MAQLPARGLASTAEGPPGDRQLYQSKLIIAQDLLQQRVRAHLAWRLPVIFDDWYTQPAFCRFLDQALGLPYVGTLSGSDKRLVISYRQADLSGGPPF